MSNPTKTQCGGDIAKFPMGDFRPRKVLYENVKNNNEFRLYLQQNAEKLMSENLRNVEGDVKCCVCEKQPTEIKGYECESSFPEQKKESNKEGGKKVKKTSPLDAFFGSLI